MNRKFLPLAILAALAAVCLFIPDVAPRATGGPADLGDTAWMLTACGLVLLMTPGLSFFYGGMVSFKNVVSTMLQSVIALGVISLVWVVVGFSLAFGDDIGGVDRQPAARSSCSTAWARRPQPALAPTIPLLVFAMFQLKFAIITPALITGSFAERVRFSAYLLFMVLFSLLIYCPLAHWTWHPEGFLHKWGVLDFAGGTVVHMSAGSRRWPGRCSWAGARATCKEGHDPREHPVRPARHGHAVVRLVRVQCRVGAGGQRRRRPWRSPPRNTASAAAMLGWIFFDWMRGRKPSALGACIGAVVGLVAITPAAGFVTIRDSIVIGLVASVVSNLAVHWKTKSTLDDTLDVFPCHGVGGMVGMIVTGIFAKDVGLWSGQTTTFLYHMMALVIVSAFSFTARSDLHDDRSSAAAARHAGTGAGGPGYQPTRRVHGTRPRAPVPSLTTSLRAVSWRSDKHALGSQR